MQQNLALSSIVRDPLLQVRERLDEGWIAELADLYRGNHDIEAIEAVFDGARYLLTDGWHRITAQEQAWGADTVVAVEIIDASGNDDPMAIAKTRAAMGNCTGGLRRTDSDKRRAALLLRSTPAGRKMTHDEIAKRIGVSRSRVTQILSAESEVSVNAGNVNKDGSARQAPLWSQVDAALKASPAKADARHAEELKCSRQVVANRREVLGLPKSDGNMRHGASNRDSMIEDLRRDPNQGSVALAEKHHTSSRAVAKARESLGLPARKPGGQPNTPPSAPVNPNRNDDAREQGAEVLASRPPPSRKPDIVTDIMQRLERADRIERQAVVVAIYKRWPELLANAVEDDGREDAVLQ